MKFKTAIFDLDGTLMNTLDDIRDSINYMLKEFSYPERSYNEIRSFVGNGMQHLVEQAVPSGLSDSQVQDCLSVFLKHYDTNMENKTAPYSGVIDVLKTLRQNGIRTAVVSNKFDEGTKLLCKKWFPEIIELALGESKTVSKKPAPDMVYEAIKQLGVEQSSALYIGDSDVDANTAKNANIPFLGVSWGFRDKELLVSLGAIEVVDRPNDILNYFEI